ncbi:hypothetical protein CEUSTIGMA_g3393.t1 [Chlamydomonas eustigma]|uniref:Glutamyl-tRNA(Gln) amidotransferase subunit C, chloroplastic/mitochondrial n=1 Tax=Chlamydomonas eustigma TaxID=1157962 RepID=A0A250WZL6_9CHLO|nr:hypothetical protein CEUSTIGMA_g3393.t1 [Chlamydomonas eustigma]|eukprot:GAX75950.1 hypothetical protein CEUSTIGMA_g3393.t1 [Chlamydomonas eustigma]
MQSVFKLKGHVCRCMISLRRLKLSDKSLSLRPSSSSSPDVKELAKMAQIAVSDAEAKEWQPKINSIIDWFGQLQKAQVSGVTPSIHAVEEGIPLRIDQPVLHEARSEVLALAPSVERGYIRVPKTGIGADSLGASAGSGAEETNVTSSSSPGLAPITVSEPVATSVNAAANTVAEVEDRALSAPPTKEELEAFQALDLRVGKIVSCEKHPDADSLYVEKIDVGEPELRTIVSGLVKFVPIEQMQDRSVIVICNLKPRNMRGIKSFGMVLAASNSEHTVVEPIAAPPESKPGERIFVGEHKDQAPPATANVVEKKKHWENVQPGLVTAEDRSVTWRGLKLQVLAGTITSTGLVGARVA